MGIFGYLKGIIALTILAFIGYINLYAYNFTGEATAENHGDLAPIFLWSMTATTFLFSVLVVGLFLSYRSLKKENKRLKSKLESQGD